MRRALLMAGLAGILSGLEADAKAHGLKLLLDVRDRTQAWCFNAYNEQFNRRMLCTQDLKKPHARDLAIAPKR